jgi:hypothetical protein
MDRIVARFSSQLEFNRAIGLLEGKNIPHQKREFGYNPYPTPIPNASIGEITVDGTDRDAFVEVLSADKDSGNLVVVETIREVAVNKSKNKLVLKLFLVVFILGTVIASGLAYKYLKMAESAYYSKNFDYEWSFDNSTLYTRDTLNGQIVSTCWDKNYNHNFEKCEGIDYLGNITLSIDADEDGYYEQTHHFNKERKLTGEYHDRDHDGFLEYYATYLESKDTLLFLDANMNGIWEMEIKPFK